MRKIDKELDDILIDAEFVKSDLAKNMYYTSDSGDVKQIFLPSFIRKMGSVRFDGYIGLYFLEFENKWKESKGINPFYRFSAPSFGISISNFLDLSAQGVFHYTRNESDLLKSAVYIRDKCRNLPSSAEELRKCCDEGRILGRNFSDYINIYEGSHENNARLLKLANFLRWFIRRYDLSAAFNKSLLDRYQMLTIEKIPDDCYYVN